MTDLTDKWKKGELPEGRYFVNVKGYNETTMLYYWSDMFLDGDVPVNNSKIMEILAEVPSYDKWKASEKQNTQLKELLKECKPYVNNRLMETREHLNKPYTATDKVLHKRAEKLLTKIDEVLG